MMNLLLDEKPSLHRNEFLKNPILSCLQHVKENPKYHPEGNTFEHVMIVLDNAAHLFHVQNFNQKYHEQVMVNAITHDLGKIITSLKFGNSGKHWGHEKYTFMIDELGFIPPYSVEGAKTFMTVHMLLHSSRWETLRPTTRERIMSKMGHHRKTCFLASRADGPPFSTLSYH